MILIKGAYDKKQNGARTQEHNGGNGESFVPSSYSSEKQIHNSLEW